MELFSLIVFSSRPLIIVVSRSFSDRQWCAFPTVFITMSPYFPKKNVDIALWHISWKLKKLCRWNIPAISAVKRTVTPWRHQMETFSVLLAICTGIHRSPVNSPHKGQWRGTLMFSLICVWINGWVNNRDDGDLRRYGVRYDVTVMLKMRCIKINGVPRHPLCMVLQLVWTSINGNKLRVWHTAGQ